MRNLFRALCCLLFVLFICSTQTASKMLVSPPAGGGADVDVSDDWAGVGDGTNIGANWTENNSASGDTVVSSTALAGNSTNYQRASAIYSGSSLSGTDQYVCVESARNLGGGHNTAMGVVFRSDADGSESHFRVYINDYDDDNDIHWVRYEGDSYQEEIAVETGEYYYADDNFYCFLISGSGTSVTVKFWDDLGSFPGTDTTTWGAADVTMSHPGGGTGTDDSGNYVGVHIYEHSTHWGATIETFYGGDAD